MLLIFRFWDVRCKYAAKLYDICGKYMLHFKYNRVIMLCVSDAWAHFSYIGMSPSGKAPDFDSGIRRFKSCHPSHMIR